MTLDQHAPLDLLMELQLTETTDQVRAATLQLYQELINAEATAVIDTGPRQRSDEWTGDLEVRIPKFRPGASFPRCWNGAAGSVKPSTRW